MNLEENPIYQQAQQMQHLHSLNTKQRARLQAYMRLGGLTFEAAHDAVLRTDPLDSVGQGSLIRLVSINLPDPRVPRGRKLTRRQRRNTTR